MMIILKQFHVKFHNTDINKPEMCNGLDKCEIYKPSKEDIKAERNAEVLTNVITKLKHKKNNLNLHKFNNSEPVKNTSHNESKHELSGLATLGKVSALKHLKTTSVANETDNVKENIHNHLKSVFEGNEENLIPKSENIKKKVKM